MLFPCHGSRAPSCAVDVQLSAAPGGCVPICVPALSFSRSGRFCHRLLALSSGDAPRVGSLATREATASCFCSGPRRFEVLRTFAFGHCLLFQCAVRVSFGGVERPTLSLVARVPMRMPVVPLGVHTCVGFPRLQHSARARSCHLGLRACSVASPPAASLLSTRRAPARCTSLFAPCRLSPPPRFPPLLWPPGAAPRARRRSRPRIRLAVRARAPAA